jgi:N4-gp56 family major capsid protein
MPTNKNVMTTTQVDHPVNIYYQRKVLTRVIAAMVYEQFGQKYSMPQHEGDVMKWRRWSNLAARTTPLVEAQDPAPSLISKTDLSVTIREYGAWVKNSSWMKFTGLSSDQDEIANVLLDNMRLTLDTLCRDVTAGTASSTTCSNGSGTSTFLSKTDIDTVVTNLEGYDANMITGRMGAATGQGTSPIRAGYVAIGHTAQRPRLEAVSGFKHVANYAAPGEAYPHEFGCTGNVRWILTTNAYVSGSNYYNLIMAKDFFGNAKITGNSADRPLIYTPPERTGSPLQRFSYLGWLQNYACKILNDQFGHALISTV